MRESEHYDQSEWPSWSFDTPASIRQRGDVVRRRRLYSAYVGGTVATVTAAFAVALGSGLLASSPTPLAADGDDIGSSTASGWRQSVPTQFHLDAGLASVVPVRQTGVPSSYADPLDSCWSLVADAAGTPSVEARSLSGKDSSGTQYRYLFLYKDRAEAAGSLRLTDGAIADCEASRPDRYVALGSRSSHRWAGLSRIGGEGEKNYAVTATQEGNALLVLAWASGEGDSTTGQQVPSSVHKIADEMCVFSGKTCPVANSE